HAPGQVRWSTAHNANPPTSCEARCDGVAQTPSIVASAHALLVHGDDRREVLCDRDQARNVVQLFPDLLGMAEGSPAARVAESVEPDRWQIVSNEGGRGQSLDTVLRGRRMVE